MSCTSVSVAQRADHILAVRQQIKGGTYETQAKLDIAVERLLQDLQAETGEGKAVDPVALRIQQDEEGDRMVCNDPDGLN